jgi:hypothetical protein
MNRFWLPAIALFAVTAKAQNINFTDIQHIQTALNHLTVIDLGEPIQFIAAADPDSFQIERAGNKVLLLPHKDGVPTNLILWTASRQVSYELDAPGDVARMNILVKNLPASVRASSVAPSEKEREQIAATAMTQAMLGAQDIVADQPPRVSSDAVTASIVRVLHTSDGTYLQYRIVNHSKAPFRVTTPTVAQRTPTQTPVSLLALRNHQLTPQMVSSFKAKAYGPSSEVSGQILQSDVQPGASTSGYVLIRALTNSAPELYQLDFGSTTAGPLVETVVI